MERLLNLILALLGAKRFLTKAEITSAIPGYEGSNEAKDRMFERDKDELRRIGIEIEVGQIDPLFEDEVGYRIRRDDFGISLASLSQEESVVASAALTLVSDLIDSSHSNALFFKIAALSEEGETSLARLLSQPRIDDLASRRNFRVILEAIRNRRTIEFDYVRDLDGNRQRRSVEPSRMLMRGEEWLLYGWDRGRSAARYFLLENISGDVLVGPDTFQPREEIDKAEHAPATEMIFKSHSDLSVQLAAEGGELLSGTDGQLTARFRTHNPDRLMRIMLSLDPEIELCEPRSMITDFLKLRDRLRDALR